MRRPFYHMGEEPKGESTMENVKQQERLTEQCYCGYDIAGRENFEGYDNENDAQRIFRCLQKLGLYEEIDVKLVIILTEDGFWYKGQNGGIFHGFGMLDLLGAGAIVMDEDDGDRSIFPFCRYGKTWAATKEELL